MKKRIGIPILLLVCALMLGIFGIQEARAADSYTNARIFFETCNSEKNHCEFRENAFFYATKAKLASSNKKKRFNAIGWDITASAGGKSLTVSIGRYTTNSVLKEIGWTDDDTFI